MRDIIRDSTVGQIINSVSGGRYLPYADQRDDYAIPAHFLLPPSISKAVTASISDKQIPARTESATPVDTSHRASSPLTRLNSLEKSNIQDHGRNEVKDEIVVFDPYLVGWNGDDDQENPRYATYGLWCLIHSSIALVFSNWSFGKRAFTTFTISVLTFSVYIGSAIYTPAIPGLMETFDISLAKATLGLTLYILGKNLWSTFVWTVLT
jgi:DHA1 family multidrug resistance protein-like MFS transporter